MYEENPEFTKPNGNPKLWRFMDFTKFINILHSNSLYFCRSDLLGDPFEGTLTEFTIKKEIALFDKFLSVPQDSQLRTELDQNKKIMHQLWNRSNFISCWHMSEYEPYGMWKTYTKTNEAVSIQSSWSRFIGSFSETKESVHVGLLNYLDYRTDDNSGNLYKKLLTKRKNFSHEAELRAIVTHLSKNDIVQDPIDPSNPQKTIVNWDAFQHGLNIKVNLECLIEKIIVAPNAPSWFKSLVESVCHKYDIRKHVENSEIDQDPISY